MDRIRLALIGFGKIARDKHLPALRANRAFELVAIVDPHSQCADMPCFATFEELLVKGPALDAVALCTPPQVRQPLAMTALAAGLHVLLEKPPGATLSAVEILRDAAQSRGVTLFAAWHSRFAAGVAPARAWLKGRVISSVHIRWREDVRVWHPGQTWIWEPGGMGVFDPGINALSIVTHILPRSPCLTRATLFTPANVATPIAAELGFTDAGGTPVTADFDFRQTGPQSWDIEVETDAGTLRLADGGATLILPTGTQRNENREYDGVYAQFAQLIRAKQSDVDIAPLRLVADAMMIGRQVAVEPFVE